MSMRSGIAVIAALALLAPSAASADTVRLTTGETLLGQVESASFTEVRFAAVFPQERSHTLSAEEIDPASHYELLSARLPAKDAQARLKLARFCFERQLYAQSVLEAGRAVALDPKLGDQAEELRGRAREGIAGLLLAEGETLLAAENWRRAKLYLESVLERYPRTKAAREARKLLKHLRKPTQEEEPEPISSSREKDRLRKRLTQAKKLVEKADGKTNSMQRHFKTGRSDELLLKRAIAYYKKAHGLVRRAAARGTDEGTLSDQLTSASALSRDRLAKAFLELGTLYLSRGAIQAAEDACSQACALAPEDKHLHTLHEKIVQARITLRFSGS